MKTKETPNGNSIAITGSGDLLGYSNLAISIVFDVQDDEVVGTASGTFDPLSTMTLPVLTWIEVGDIVLTTSIRESVRINNAWHLRGTSWLGNRYQNSDRDRNSTRFRVAL